MSDFLRRLDRWRAIWDSKALTLVSLGLPPARRGLAPTASSRLIHRVSVFALQQYQQEDPEFHPFDSKYDQFLAGKTQLTDAELRGLALFNDPGKGNCAACHPSAPGADGAPPLFTDFSFDNLGVPRNPAIPATADPAYFDMGLCCPDRTRSILDPSVRRVQVPTLRNVATRKVFFHNGYFKSLRDALGFYVRRDTNPEE